MKASVLSEKKLPVNTVTNTVCLNLISTDSVYIYLVYSWELKYFEETMDILPVNVLTVRDRNGVHGKQKPYKLHSPADCISRRKLALTDTYLL